MEIVKTSQMLGRITRAENQQICPECGVRMAEMDRLCEGNYVFVWYKCSKTGCRGQWLAKIPRPTEVFGSGKIGNVGSPVAAI